MYSKAPRVCFWAGGILWRDEVKISWPNWYFRHRKTICRIYWMALILYHGLTFQCCFVVYFFTLNNEFLNTVFATGLPQNSLTFSLFISSAMKKFMINAWKCRPLLLVKAHILLMTRANGKQNYNKSCATSNSADLPAKLCSLVKAFPGCVMASQFKHDVTSPNFKGSSWNFAHLRKILPIWIRIISFFSIFITLCLSVKMLGFPLFV